MIELLLCDYFMSYYFAIILRFEREANLSSLRCDKCDSYLCNVAYASSSSAFSFVCLAF